MDKLLAFVCGGLFGTGLVISAMINPQKVIGFLDVAGEWDPTLIFVMIGALIPTTIGWAIAKRRHKSFFGMEFSMPTAKDIDKRLVLGSTIFGVGWGFVGLCPGPVLAGLAIAPLSLLYFFLAMIMGMVVYKFLNRVVLTRT